MREGTQLSIPTTQEEQSREIEKVFETIRPDLNIEKHADFIFAPAHSKNLHKPRSRTWLETQPDGTKVKASIVIDLYRSKTPTTRTRKVYLALQKLTEDKGWNDEERTNFSLYEVATTVGWKWSGNRTIKQIRDELMQLRMTPFIWQYSFTDEDGHKVDALDTFNILDHLKVIEKKDRATNQYFLSLSSFRFHEEIRKNLKANHTKPTNLTALTIQGEIASVLYARLDIVMADKTHYERLTEGLFKDLYLDGDKYRYPSARKQNLEKAIKELDGKPISTGVIHLTIERSKETKDWKLVVRKLPFPDETKKVHIPERVGPANPPEAIPLLANDIAGTIGQGEKNHPLYIRLCKTYTADILYQALSEWKSDGGGEARNPRGYFMAILHRIAHQRGKLWLNKMCPSHCKYQPPSLLA